MRKCIVDANVFLRFFLDDIPEQKQQFEKLLLESRKGNLRLFVPQIVLFEINFILTKEYHLEKTIIIERLNDLLSSQYFTVESRDLFMAALSVYARNTISLPDSFIFARTKQENAELFTFDKKLQKLALS